MPIKFRLFSNSSQTLMEQIRQQFELAIAKGAMESGEALPSVRQLALDLKVNPNTVAKAYQQLVQSGTVISQRGRGYFVAESTVRFSETETARQLASAAEKFVADTRPLGLSRQQLLCAIEKLLGEEK